MSIFKIYVREIFDFVSNFIVKVDFYIFMVCFWLVVFSGVFIGVYEIIEFYEDKNYYIVRGSLKVIKFINEIIVFVLFSKNN